MKRADRQWINSQVKGYRESLKEHDPPCPDILEDVLIQAYQRGAQSMKQAQQKEGG
jgi:hypothetical protein